MIYPTVHLNGTSKAELREQLQEASSALRVAIEKLTAASPNGRDYYVQGPDALSVAKQEWHARFEALFAVRTDLAEIWENIEDQ